MATPRERERQRVKRTRDSILWCLLAIGLSGFFYFASDREATITVLGKSEITRRISHKSSHRIPVVQTEDGLYEISPSLVFRSFGAGRINNRLREGETYRVRIAGWDIPFLSRYRNILEIIEEPQISARP
jgi:hypothetical protein